VLRTLLKVILLLVVVPILARVFVGIGCASGFLEESCGHSSVFTSLMLATIVAWLLLATAWAFARYGQRLLAKVSPNPSIEWTSKDRFARVGPSLMSNA
jgi:ABC-type sugar transport system permease subunit